MSTATPVSSSLASSIAFPSGTVTQPGPGGFILVNPPQVNMAGYFTQYPEFSGRGNDDVEQHWYLCEEIWRARQTLDAGKLIEFQTTLRERALRWFIKWSEAHPNPVIVDVKWDFVQEFKFPQTDQQGLSELWEIKQKEGETSWELM